jgi:hypothetical protein
MKQIMRSMPTYLKDYQTLINDIKNLGQQSPNAKLFTTNVTVMYTNIQPEVGISSIVKWIELYPQMVPHDAPRTILLKLLKIIMT